MCYINRVFRVYFHNGIHGFTIVEAGRPEGPYRIIEDHHLSDMAEQWAPWVFEDDDQRKYLVCSNWIQELSADGLAFAGSRTPVTTGFLENPWLIKKEGMYYWLCSENGTDYWGMLPDKSKVSVWRSPAILRPYEKCPRPLIKANLKFQCPNTGSAVMGPDHHWWYVYNTIQVERPTLCRQMHLDGSIVMQTDGRSLTTTWVLD